MISVEHLTKYYGTTCAVDDVSFTIGRGEVAALLGPNGSGKTTLMRVLTGYFPPTAGRVCIDGEDVAEQPAAARRRVGYLPEQVSLYPELTVRRYLAFVAEVKGLGGRARRAAVADAIARCGLAEVADRLAGKLSKGYRQRVGLAQALVGDADVLVLDEPTVGLGRTASRALPSHSSRTIPSRCSGRSAPRWWRAAGRSSRCGRARPPSRICSSTWSGRRIGPGARACGASSRSFARSCAPTSVRRSSISWRPPSSPTPDTTSTRISSTSSPSASA